jgi:hypothetical protein
MVTLTRTLGQYLKNKGQPIATPMLGEIKARRREGFHNRLASVIWKEKVRLEADLKGL